MFIGLEPVLSKSFSCVQLQRGCKPYERPQLLRKHQQVMSHVGIKGGSVYGVFLFIGAPQTELKGIQKEWSPTTCLLGWNL
jgi:hypothetical protein